MTEAPFFATAPRGIEEVLADELRALGAQGVELGRGGVSFGGPLEIAYRVCLWSRTASRVLMPLARFQALDAEALYEGTRKVDWGEHLGPDGTLAIDVAAAGETPFANTHFVALKVKDAVVDQLRERFGRRPSVDTERPDVRVNVFQRREETVLSLDLSGESLHRRGWRRGGAPAPLKENLASAMLLLAGWPRAAEEGRPLLDPMCGSGTLPIEAALMAADVAPGLQRSHYGFTRWRGHQAAAWQGLLREARERDRRPQGIRSAIFGSDVDAGAVRAASDNARKAGVARLVHFERRELAACEAPEGPPGILVVNPPYGERLGEQRDLVRLYGRLGDTLKQRFKGWSGYVLAGNLELAKSIGLRATRRHVLFNGPIECRLLEIPVHADEGAPKPARPPEEADAFANRLRKNLKHLGRWAKREGVTCYRLYDADIPEYALAVDRYERWVHVQEYEPPATVDMSRAEARLHQALKAIEEVLEIPSSDVFLKVRRRQRGGEQYRKLGEIGELREVGEGGHRFLVNFTDYLDTGLFLDHRITRRIVGELARGRDFLNLFAYTATATVYAARGGARSTTSVDLSNTYLEWAHRNLELNGIRGQAHRLVRDDCLQYLEHERRRYGLIFLDPPTFSSSKAMQATFDVQRDHPELLRRVGALLEPGGILVFSNNFRRFKLEREALAGFEVQDITRQTLPPDFARNPRIHNTWRIEKPR